MSKWSKEEIWQWYDEYPYLMGFNYVPSTAINAINMWQDLDFNLKTIDAELALAEEYGFNTCRIFLHYLVWKQERQSLKIKIDQFLNNASRHGMKVLVVLFDDCNFGNSEPYIGEQLPPIPGKHNSRWVASPGSKICDAISEWEQFETYIKDILTTFKDDKRILAWDLYNEPGNNGRGEKSLPLLKATFEWARNISPSQPLTSGAWEEGLKSPCDQTCIELSDIVSFHAYWDFEKTKKIVIGLQKIGRPIMCTEWLHRGASNVVKEIIPYFSEHKIAAFNWGLICGKTQTNLNWDTIEGEPDSQPDVWQHDLFYYDHVPYDVKEMEIFKSIATSKKIYFHPVEMTVAIMELLEKKGCIRCLAPGKIKPIANEGETIGIEVYKSDVKFGAHMLIEVIVNRDNLSQFGYHPDNEEFLLIGKNDSKPLYLIIALCNKDVLEEKIKSRRLLDNDFITLKIKYNDPEVSFFTMLKNIPHGEMIKKNCVGNAATFYVTEPENMGIIHTHWHGFEYHVLDA